VLQPSAELRALYDVDFDWARGLELAIERIARAEER
jgi:hypothetical protein